MEKNKDVAFLYRVAKLYYQEGLSQQEIAEQLNTSRTHISRSLDKARKIGIVEIKVAPPSDQYSATLARSIEQLLGLEKALIMPSYNNIDEDQLIDDLASFSASNLPDLLEGCNFIGVGWGRTLYRIPQHLPEMPPYWDRTFIPLLGNSGRKNRYLQTSTIVNRFGDKFQAECFYLNMPVVQSIETPLSDYAKAVLAELEQYWTKLDAALFSAGPALRQSYFYIDEITPQVAKDYNYDFSACGEIFIQSFYQDGSSRQFEPGYNMIALDIQRLKQIPNTILIAAGKHKRHAIYWAAKLGFCKILITDSHTAELILEG